MTFDNTDLSVNIDFTHNPRLKVTTCNISLSNTGASRCSPSDTWNDFVGEINAFERAVSAFPREVRTALWLEFWKDNERPEPRRRLAKAA